MQLDVIMCKSKHEPCRVVVGESCALVNAVTWLAAFRPSVRIRTASISSKQGTQYERSPRTRRPARRICGTATALQVRVDRGAFRPLRMSNVADDSMSAKGKKKKSQEGV